MGMALVYHETHQFVRLVQIMQLQRTIWQFLTPMQRLGAPLPRATLVRRCINDQVGERLVSAFILVSRLCLAVHDTECTWPQPTCGLPVQAVLRFVADNARAAAATGASSQLQVAFFAVLTAEVLQASPKRLDEGTVVRLGLSISHSGPHDHHPTSVL